MKGLSEIFNFRMLPWFYQDMLPHSLISFGSLNYASSFVSAIKQRMEKDVDEVKKIALKVKTSLEEIDRDVSFFIPFCSLPYLLAA